MFKFFKKQEEPKNLKELLSEFGILKERLDKLSQELENLKSENKFSIQKVGLVRFNPFKEVGGNQSFSLALLDSYDSGIVITSLYSRAENRFYGKTVKNGQSDYSLSQEEKEAIQMAKKRLSPSGRTLFIQGDPKNEKNNKRKIGNSAAGSGGSGTH